MVGATIRSATRSPRASAFAHTGSKRITGQESPKSRARVSSAEVGSLVIVYVKHIQAFAAQRRMLPSEPHQVAREATVIRHVR